MLPILQILTPCLLAVLSRAFSAPVLRRRPASQHGTARIAGRLQQFFASCSIIGRVRSSCVVSWLTHVGLQRSFGHADTASVNPSPGALRRRSRLHSLATSPAVVATRAAVIRCFPLILLARRSSWRAGCRIRCAVARQVVAVCRLMQRRMLEILRDLLPLDDDLLRAARGKQARHNMCGNAVDTTCRPRELHDSAVLASPGVPGFAKGPLTGPAAASKLSSRVQCRCYVKRRAHAFLLPKRAYFARSMWLGRTSTGARSRLCARARVAVGGSPASLWPSLRAAVSGTPLSVCGCQEHRTRARLGAAFVSIACSRAPTLASFGPRGLCAGGRLVFLQRP